jgi:hypothetical protein
MGFFLADSDIGIRGMILLVKHLEILRAGVKQFQ